MLKISVVVLFVLLAVAVVMANRLPVAKVGLDDPVKKYMNNGKPNKANYAFGWEIGGANGHRVIAHGGAWQGFACYIARYVDDRLTAVALTNLESGRSNPKKRDGSSGHL